MRPTYSASSSSSPASAMSTSSSSTTAPEGAPAGGAPADGAPDGRRGCWWYGSEVEVPTRPGPNYRLPGASDVPIGSFQTLACWSALSTEEKAQLEPVDGTTVYVPIWLLLIMIIGCDVDGRRIDTVQQYRLWFFWICRYNKGKMPFIACWQLFVAAFSQAQAGGNTVITSRAAASDKIDWCFDGGAAISGEARGGLRRR
jgi:hypothetical protein